MAGWGSIAWNIRTTDSRASIFTESAPMPIQSSRCNVWLFVCLSVKVSQSNKLSMDSTYHLPKGNKILLSLAPILMQTILAPTFFFIKFFLADIFLFDAYKRICFCFYKFRSLMLVQKWRRPYLCQLFSYATHINTCQAKPNVARLLIDQLKSGKGQIM